MPPNHRMAATEWALLALLSLLWGGSFFFAKVAVATLPPLTVVLARVGLAALALALYLRWRGTPWPRDRAVWRAFVGMGLLNNLIPFALMFWGQTVLSSALASVLNATTPVFSLLVAHVLTADEKLAVHKVVGIALGVAGVAVLVGVEAVSQADPAILPILACLGAALSYGFASVFGRRFKRLGIDPVVGAFGQTAATSLMTVPLVLAVAAPWHSAWPDAPTWAALVGLALLSTALAYVLFFQLLATVGAINTSLVTLLIPVSAILLGSVFLGERLTGPQIGGMLLIGAGLLAIDGRILARHRVRA
ncbi:MAG: eamA-like transporter family protein [Enterovirga sp.]|jgi:drug/metabolite transporter (DMT)-like permease|nr:eamA-like transporter family protein [Enterovirga sp.]